jgi:SPP1 gp7 family putative phage head morphogenesis protein
MLTALREQFEDQRQQVIANLDPSKITKGYTKKDYLSDFVNWPDAAESLRQAVQPILFSLVSETGQDAIRAIGLEASQFNPITTAILNYNQERATKIAADVNDETEKQLRAALSQGVSDGKSVEELRAVVEDVMGNASTTRADRIARTEVSRAQGYGDIQAWTQSGVVSGKEWFTAEDEHVCLFCDELDGKVVGLEENFFDEGDTQSIDGEDKDGEPKTYSQKLSYDDVPSAPLHPNCRCTLLPVRTS